MSFSGRWRPKQSSDSDGKRIGGAHGLVAEFGEEEGGAYRHDGEERNAGDDGDRALLAGECITDERADRDRRQVDQGRRGGDADEYVAVVGYPLSSQNPAGALQPPRPSGS
jgi:hypothetical protein